MDQSRSQRRGAVTGVTAVAGLAVAAFGAIGIAQHNAATAQNLDFTLVNAADVAHTALIDAQVAQDSSLFDNDVALQQSIFYYATEPSANGGLGLDASSLFPGDPTDQADSIFNGAFSRFTEAGLVGQALQQAQLDHLLGVNQTLGAGGYESAIGNQLYTDLSGTGITPDSTLDTDLTALLAAAGGTSYSDFTSALTTLQGDLVQTGFSDLLGIFTQGMDLTPLDLTP
jgi:hypothetical protein